MRLEKVVDFLDKQGWKKASNRQGVAAYSPPTDLGLKSSYTLSIPLENGAKNFKKDLTDAVEILSEIYGKRPEQLFFDVGDYLDVLKQSALYFKLSSTEVMHGHTIELDNIWKFLKNLSTSYSNYIKAKFTKEFHDFFEGDAKKIKSAANKITELSSLRLVDLEYKSFSFGVSSDVLMGNEIIDIKEIKDWRKSILPAYTNEIISIDFSSEKDVQHVLENFSEEERRSIFSPLFQSINRDDYKIHVTNSSFVSKKSFSKVPFSTMNAIIPSPKKEQEASNIKLMQVIVPYDTSKSKITFKTREIANDLFSRPIDEYKVPVKYITFEDKEIIFKSPINFIVKKEEESNEFSIFFKQLNIIKKTDDFNKIKEEIYEVLNQNIGYYYYLKQRKKTEIISEEQGKVISFFNGIIPKV